MHRGQREVRRADERGREPAPSMQDPRLRVELRAHGIERDADLGSRVDERVERLRLRRAHVCRRDHPQLPAAFDDEPQLVEHRVDAAEDHEGAEKVDVVGTLELAHELRADRRLLAIVDQQLVSRQRDLRALGQRGALKPAHERANPRQQTRWREQREPARQLLAERAGKRVDKVRLRGRPGRRRHRLKRIAHDLRGVPAQQLERLGALDLALLNPRLDRLEPARERLCDELLAQAGRKFVIRALHCGHSIP